MATRTVATKASLASKQKQGTSNRVNCADCGRPTTHRRRCEGCTEVYNLKRRKRRRE